jgi:transposase
MGRALSMDLRTRIGADWDRGLPALAIAQKYSVARRTVNNLVHLRDRTGSLEPVPGSRGRKSVLRPRKQEILEALQADPGLTLQGLKTQLRLPVALSSLWTALHKWGLRLKKSSARRRTAAA